MGYNEADVVRLVRRVSHKGKKCEEYKKISFEKFLQQCQDSFLILLKKKSIGFFYE